MDLQQENSCMTQQEIKMCERTTNGRVAGNKRMKASQRDEMSHWGRETRDGREKRNRTVRWWTSRLPDSSGSPFLLPRRSPGGGTAMGTVPPLSDDHLAEKLSCPPSLLLSQPILHSFCKFWVAFLGIKALAGLPSATSVLLLELQERPRFSEVGSVREQRAHRATCSVFQATRCG